MFRDYLSVRIKNIVFPFLFWVAAGAAAELLAALILIVSGKNQGDFFTALSLAHEKWEIWLVLFRALVIIPLFIRRFREDSYRIRMELPKHRTGLPERREFFEPPAHFCVFELLCIPISISFMLFFSLFLQTLGVTDTAFSGFAQTEHIVDFAGLLFLEVIAGPVSEELLLRGLIYRRLRTWSRLTMAVMVSSLIFAFLHWNLSQLIYAFFFGFVLAFLYEGSGTLRDSVLAHSAANLLAVILWLRPGLSESLMTHMWMTMIGSGILFFGCFFAYMHFANARTATDRH